MADERSTRIAKLASRVRWLERNRKLIRTAVVIVVGGVGFVTVPALLGGDWPRFHARLMGVALGFALAFVVDISLVALMTLWEVRHDRMVRTPTEFPRAVLRRK